MGYSGSGLLGEATWVLSHFNGNKLDTLKCINQCVYCLKGITIFIKNCIQMEEVITNLRGTVATVHTRVTYSTVNTTMHESSMYLNQPGDSGGHIIVPGQRSGLLSHTGS